MKFERLSLSAETEQLFARGFPHVRTLTDDKLTREKSIAVAARVGEAVDPTNFGPWTRDSATRCVRSLVHNPHRAKETFHAALENDAPFDVSEVATLLAAMRNSLYAFQGEEFVLLLEALADSDAVLLAWVAHLEAVPERVGGLDLDTALVGFGFGVGFPMGFLMLRCSPATRVEVRERLVTLRSRRPSALLDLLIDPNGAVSRQGIRKLAGTMFCDDPSLVLERAGADTFDNSLTPRFAYLGGRDVLATYVPRMKRVPRERAARLVGEFGTIEDPGVIPLMLVLASKSPSQKAAHAWFAKHRERVRSEVERHAAGGEHQDAAKAVLAAWVTKPSAKKPRVAKVTEESLSADLAASLGAARGDEAKERAAIATILERFSEHIGDPQICKAGHLFAVDGTDAGPPALDRLDPTDEERERWMGLLMKLL